MAGTSQISVTSGAFISLGTGPMLISPENGIQIVAASSQPAKTTIGHPLNYLAAPFFFPLTEQVWAMSLSAAAEAVTVTV